MVAAGAPGQLVRMLRSEKDVRIALAVVNHLAYDEAARACVAAGAVAILLELIANRTSGFRNMACHALYKISANQECSQAIYGDNPEGFRALLRLLQRPPHDMDEHGSTTVVSIVANVCFYGSAEAQDALVLLRAARTASSITAQLKCSQGFLGAAKMLNGII